MVRIEVKVEIYVRVEVKVNIRERVEALLSTWLPISTFHSVSGIKPPKTRSEHDRLDPLHSLLVG